MLQERTGQGGAPARDAEASAGAQLDGVDLDALARRIATPFYAYSANSIRARIAEFCAAVEGLHTLVCYAVKANPNRAILGLMARAGIGADIVSGGELRRAMRAGIPAQRIVFSGVGKTADEIDAGLAAGILRFNVESHEELDLLQQRARAHGSIARAAVRVNPDVDAGTHAKISTGRAENKFGVAPAQARAWFAARERWPDVRLDGLHVHIGSQLLSVAPYEAAFRSVAAFARELAAGGSVVDSIDFGGGLGVRYRPGAETPVALADYVRAARNALGDFGGRVIFEPGRWLVAEAGVLVTRVIRTKRSHERDFVVVDAAMNDLARPSLYDAWHEIEPIAATERELVSYDVVGPVCESADTFARARPLPRCAAGDLLMIRDVGAYGTSMSSTFNSRPLAAELLLDNGRYAVIRPRQTFAQMLAGESEANLWQTP
jgi:diaminopimelate decarboxylase